MSGMQVDRRVGVGGKVELGAGGGGDEAMSGNAESDLALGRRPSNQQATGASQPPHALQSAPPPLFWPVSEKNEARAQATFAAKSSSYGVAHYSLTPPTTSEPGDAPAPTQPPHSTFSTLSTYPTHTTPVSLPPSPTAADAVSVKPRAKRGRHKVITTAETEKDQPKEKSSRKRPAAAKSAAEPSVGRKKGKVEQADASANHVSSEGLGSCSAAAISPSSNNPYRDPNPPMTMDKPTRHHDAHADDAPLVPSPPTLKAPSSVASSGTRIFDPVRSVMVLQKDPAPRSYSLDPPPTTSATRPNVVPPASTTSATANAGPVPTVRNPPSTVTSASQADVVADQPMADATDAQQAAPASPPSVAPSLAKPISQVKKGSSGTPSTAPSPKPSRNKEQAPSLPPGSGLLSSALFGGNAHEAAAAANPSSEQAPSIYVHVKLPERDNNIINFAQLAEQKYGFAALHPRLAAQQDRLAKVAAAGAALEKSNGGSKLAGLSAGGDSGEDDLSVDVDRESDNDGDVAMTAANGGGTAANSGTDGAGGKKRRKKKVEEYDQDDPFVDDSEMAWEAQAAAVKDGFFVYCGPLIPEGEKAAVERPDGTVKRGRGRGRGGGPGSRGGRGAAAAANGESGSGRGGGPGSRGGGATRKPRGTKAARANLEREKQEREKMAPLAAKGAALSTTAS